MEWPVDIVVFNKNTLLCLGSSWSCGVSLSSGLVERSSGGGLHLISSLKAKGRFVTRVGSEGNFKLL